MWYENGPSSSVYYCECDLFLRPAVSPLLSSSISFTKVKHKLKMSWLKRCAAASVSDVILPRLGHVQTTSKNLQPNFFQHNFRPYFGRHFSMMASQFLFLHGSDSPVIFNFFISYSEGLILLSCQFASLHLLLASSH